MTEHLIEQTENGIRTKCRQCIFTIVDENSDGCETQIGCDFLSRLTIFQQQGRAEQCDGFYEIKTLCNAARSQEWKDGTSFSDNLTMKEAILKEIDLEVDIAIIDKSDSIEQATERLKKTYESIQKMCSKPSKIIVVTKFPIIKMMAEVRQVLSNDIPFVVAQNFDDEIYTAVSKMQSAYLMLTENGCVVPMYIIDSLNELINIDLETIVGVFPGFLTGTLFLGNLYRAIEARDDIEFDVKTLYDSITELGFENTIRKYL